MSDNNIINVAFCSDKNYLEYVAIAIKSVQLNNFNNNIHFHVFLYDVLESEINKFQELGSSIKIHIVPKKELDKYQNEHQLKHLNRAMYIRLLVPRLLKNEVDKFIYLDADTLCFHDLLSINDINIDSVICAVVSDSLRSQSIIKNVTRLKLDTQNYFNSGFLYINTRNWCEFDVENKVNAVLSDSSYNLIYPDQDALNIVLQDKIKLIDSKWNYLFTWMSEQEKESFFYDKNSIPYIVHFTGARKPWYLEHTGLAQNLYLFYKHFTPWANESLKSYLPRMRVNDYRIYAKSFFKKGDIIKSIKYFIRYFLLKIS